MLKELIATPGEAIVGRLAKQYRIDPDAQSLLIAEIDKAVAVEREACAQVADDRAAICRDAAEKANSELDRVAERRCALEEVHVASLIRARSNSSK